ncbi:MAG TPA: aspartate-semialdehyde dehydrogenase [Thermoanaerobaculia bacterium]|nr:aspartate-semialdehyde dehydrogenase [Thermoanaerobaculia bacterium]
MSPTPRPRIPVGVLGATGTVGQRFLSLLADHPWFRVVAVTGSDRTVGKRYGEAVQWILPGDVPAEAAALTVLPTAPDLAGADGKEIPLLFSALGSDVAGPAEAELRDAGYFVVSNAGSHRMDHDVPLVVPEVNGDHLEILRGRKGRGAIATNPNCSTIGLVLALRPLHDRFGIEAVNVVTLQAVSGAGLPGVASLQILDNVIPYIPSEEEKIESETCRILGRLGGAGGGPGIEPAPIAISAQCNRVPVLDGHTECVSVRLRDSAAPAQAAAALRELDPPGTRDLPSAPRPPIVVVEAADRPQPRLDRGRGRGMAVTVGRIRPCPVLDLRFVLLSHNTLRGAAGGALLVAEQAVAAGLVEGVVSPVGQAVGGQLLQARGLKPRKSS